MLLLVSVCAVSKTMKEGSLTKPPHAVQLTTKETLLNLTREAYRLRALSPGGKPYDKVVVGAAIFHPASTKGHTPNILLLKRSANEIYYPNVFELPSGNVDVNDPSIMHGLAREVVEETGLRMTRVIAELPEFLYSTEKHTRDEDGKLTTLRKSCVQLNFVVAVDGDVIQVSPEEHSVGEWATRERVMELDMTEGMRSVVINALDWKGTHTT